MSAILMLGSFSAPEDSGCQNFEPRPMDDLCTQSNEPSAGTTLDIARQSSEC
jgi:hypothetical protein